MFSFLLYIRTHTHIYACIKCLYSFYTLCILPFFSFQKNEHKQNDEYCIYLRNSDWSFLQCFVCGGKKRKIVKLHYVKCIECDLIFIFIFKLYFIPVPAVFHLWENLYRNCSLSTSLWKDKVERIEPRARKIRKSLLSIVLVQATLRKKYFIALGSGHILFWDLMANKNYNSNMIGSFYFKR